ncbi:glutathione S-transferase family protein [Haliangium ochraceum]|uniref:Glutathione S-transferase domain protein n=1 Tax=Haliangium ochraceum (strain DSM 14365 / JCM 11303 / SMP-2) TaxID=502025 RepID=D0LL76_HALO1|nr:glutathione S-transferase family protein [Haliangium ochraceum]ACY18572.1 Glutathione S-transferase domain protein [Haliangium ochraceum DSM 14365]
MKFTYFQVRGRAEPIRLMFALTGAEYEDDGVTFERWMGPEGKAKYSQLTPFGQLPTLEDDGLTLCQTGAISRYVAGKLGLYGETPAERARIDEVAETAFEIIQGTIRLIWNPQFADKRAEHRETTSKQLTALSAYFQRTRPATEGDPVHWAIPGTFTMADAYMAFALENLIKLHPGLLSEFPELEKAMTAFFAADGVREYVRSERRCPTLGPPMVQFGGKPEESHTWT